MDAIITKKKKNAAKINGQRLRKHRETDLVFHEHAHTQTEIRPTSDYIVQSKANGLTDL